jgi:glycosyl transferase family 87
LLVLLLLLASTEFVVRGPVRYFRTGYSWSDITQVYVPSRAWLEGLDPYSPDNFIALYHDATNGRVDRIGFRSHSPQPLTALVVFSPIAALPWWWAHLLWSVLTGLVIVPAIFSLASFLGVGGIYRKLGLAALTLALAPLHSGIAAGNVSIPAIAVGGVAFWAATHQKDNLAGILIALSSCLKPQIGVLFILYYLLRRQWKIALVGIGLSTAVLIVGTGRLEFSGALWWEDFLANARAMQHHRLMNFDDPSPIRFTMINLQVLLYAIISSSLVANAGAVLIGVVLCGKWAYYGLRSVAARSELLLVSTFLVIGILPIYHRNYDATILIFPLCWALSPQAELYGRGRWLAGLAMAPFLLPGPMLLQSLADRRAMPEWIVNGWWWNTILMPHQTWLLLALSIFLVQAVAFAPKFSSSAAESRGLG